MTDQAQTQDESFVLHPIGRVHRNDESIQIKVDASYRPALKQLGQFSHVMVFWWADWFDSDEYRNNQDMLQCQPPYAQEHVTGVFATRSPYRPNPVGMTTCKLLGVDEEEGSVRVADIDAVDGTRVVDLKAYFPVCDRVRQAHIPAWLADWPEWMPENGIGLEEGEG
jgi:tRNA-Thr(GGU) m(6)t(6)A37 methyltransferase TsaA